MGARSKPLRVGITIAKRIEPARGCKKGTIGLPEATSTAAPESCTWQHARSLAEEGTGQFAPQQGALIAAAAWAIPQPKPTCSANTSANSAMIAFLTKSNLILSATRRNGLVLDAQFSKPRGPAAACKMRHDAARKFAFPLGRCSKHRQKRLIDGSNIFPFSARIWHSACTGIGYEVGPDCSRIHFISRVRNSHYTTCACACLLKFRDRITPRGELRRPLQFPAKKRQVVADQR
jgi:hypothetical protein